MPTLRNKIRNIFLEFAPTRELLFFIFQKKVYKSHADKKIAALINGKRKLSENRVDNLIVSLTSFPERIADVKYVIYSLLNQTALPEKIILWLAESQFPGKELDLPEDLLALRKFGFVVEWCEDLKSYKKLIPALERFPDHHIAVADDDIYYPETWLQSLWLEHLKHPGDVICHKAEEIFFRDGRVMPYTAWRRPFKYNYAQYRTFGVGSGGLLYRKKYLHEDVCKKDLFQKLAPHADDIWFYFMTVLAGTKIRIVKNPYYRTKFVDPYREYGLRDGYTLSSFNWIDDNFNDRQIKNVVEHYNIDMYSLLTQGRANSGQADQSEVCD